MRLRDTIGKELQTLNNKNKAGKLSKTQLVKEINNIGKANNVRKAAETYTSCLKTKCAKELRTAERKKAY
jgi:RNA polymerase-interacting CarD/CdnL/TRCF family regulator